MLRIFFLEFPCAKHKVGHLPKLRPAVLPSSLNPLLPLAWVFSTYPPVSVFGTVSTVSRCETFLGSLTPSDWSKIQPFPLLAVAITDLPITADS